MNEVKLYINSQEIEFQTSPDILFTYQVDDLTNPTVVKNSYTKTLTIPGTKQNNAIFDGIWNVERIQTDENYNATKRVPFTLYVNGDIYQTGYAKLDKISRSNNKIEYSLTLYGGLGSFLYNLSIDWNTGNKKTLADMTYYSFPDSTTPLDLDFTINKETVATAWNEIWNNNKWGCVNFAPTYIGHPDKINCDKVLINFNGSSLTSAVTEDETSYTPSVGYALGTLPHALSSEEVRDYRSYIQTPVVRVKNVIEALCRKENNKGRYDDGYDVELDEDFFTTSNPYYWDSWTTLPTISNLKFSTEGGSGTTTAYTGSYTVKTDVTTGKNITTYTFALPEPITGSNTSVKMTIDLAVNRTGGDTGNTLYMYFTQLMPYGRKMYLRNGYALQLYASNSSSSFENVLAGTNVKWITGEEEYAYADAISTGQFTPKYQTSAVDKYVGNFTKVSGQTYHFSEGLIELNCDLPAGSTHFKLMIGRCDSMNSQTQKNLLFPSTEANAYKFTEIELKPFNSKEIVLSMIDSGQSISNKFISKDMLLATSYSPADFLLSYCKKFGLYINKDVVENKIYIRTRNNFFKRHIVDNIDDKIDYSKQYLVNPVYCENGYYSLTDKGVDSKYEKDYTQKTGKVYGQKIINTGYEFNADTKELNSGIFKGAVQAKDVSQYYGRPSDEGYHPYMYNGFKYNLYANGDYSGDTYEYSQPINDISVVCQPFDAGYPNYDYVSKVMLTDTEGKTLNTESILLFFNGYKGVGDLKWYLTDDVPYMYKLNNNPTWLYTESEYDSRGDKIATMISSFPRFSRWYEGNNWITYSWDYGSPRLLYVPEFSNNDDATTYHNYLEKYYEDLYDVDTKVVDCYVRGNFDEESLRQFYWFNNSIWRLNKIIDYNPTNHDTTKVQFVKVQDLNDMTNEDATSELWIKVYLDKYYLPASGGTILGTVITSDNFSWEIEGYQITPSGDSYDINITPWNYGTSGNFTITTNSNTGLDKTIKIYVVAGDISKIVEFTQEGMMSSFSVSPSKLVFNASGETKQLTISNSEEHEWVVSASPSWATYSPSSGSSTTGTIDITATSSEGVERTGSFVILDKTKNRPVTIQLKQLSTDAYLFLSTPFIRFGQSGGTAVINVESNIAWNIMYSGESLTTAITFTNLTVNDVPASGGTVTSADCNYTITAYFDNGTTGDVTSRAVVTGSVYIPNSGSQIRHSAGTITLSASYEGCNASSSGTVYQEAYDPSPTPSGTSIILINITGGSISIDSYCEVGFGSGYFSISGNNICTLGDGINTVTINGGNGYGWSNITYADAQNVVFAYNWAGSQHYYRNNCYLNLKITDGVNTVNGVLRNNYGLSTTTMDLTPFWTPDTTAHYLTLTISLFMN